MDKVVKDIPGYEGKYAISDQGNLYRTFLGAPDGRYSIVCLSDGKKKKYVRTHRLVMQTFMGDCPPGMVVNHKNGNGYDNRLENLEYVTHRDNILHARDVLKKSVGRPRKPSTPRETVLAIRADAADGMSYRKISVKHGVGTGTVYMIVNFKSRQNVT